MKEMIKELKAEIKRLSAEQRILKPQRKTVYFKGERTVKVGDATNMVESNRFTLRHMFILYGIMRNKVVDYEPESIQVLRVMRDKYAPTLKNLDKFPWLQQRNI